MKKIIVNFLFMIAISTATLAADIANNFEMKLKENRKTRQILKITLVNDGFSISNLQTHLLMATLPGSDKIKIYSYIILPPSESAKLFDDEAFAIPADTDNEKAFEHTTRVFTTKHGRKARLRQQVLIRRGIPGCMIENAFQNMGVDSDRFFWQLCFSGIKYNNIISDKGDNKLNAVNWVLFQNEDGSIIGFVGKLDKYKLAVTRQKVIGFHSDRHSKAQGEWVSLKVWMFGAKNRKDAEKSIELINNYIDKDKKTEN